MNGNTFIMHFWGSYSPPVVVGHPRLPFGEASLPATTTADHKQKTVPDPRPGSPEVWDCHVCVSSRLTFQAI